MNELVSVIVPVYNVEDYIEECLKSIQDQTYDNLEIIVVDDGSEDSSKKICESFSKKDIRVKLFSKKNGGLSDSRNYGIKKAHGNYITFIDGDDVVSEKMIEVLLNDIKRARADVSIIDPVHINGDSPIYTLSNKRELLDPESAICDMLYQKKFLVSAWGKMYRRDAFSEEKFPVGIVFEDIAIMYKIFYRSNRIVYNHSKLYGYRHRQGSITMNSFSEKDFDILKICNEMAVFFEKSTKRLLRAVRCYTLNANFRVYLNTRGIKKFEKENNCCKTAIKNNAIKVLFDFRARLKIKMAILLFLFARLLLFKIYPKVDRWR